MICSICERDTPDHYTEKHHLTPRSKHGKITIKLCCDCGDQLHKLFTNKELVKLNTVELLLSHPKVEKWRNWIKNKNSFCFCMKDKKRR